MHHPLRLILVAQPPCDCCVPIWALCHLQFTVWDCKQAFHLSICVSLCHTDTIGVDFVVKCPQHDWSDDCRCYCWQCRIVHCCSINHSCGPATLHLHVPLSHQHAALKLTAFKIKTSIAIVLHACMHVEMNGQQCSPDRFFAENLHTMPLPNNAAIYFFV